MMRVARGRGTWESRHKDGEVKGKERKGSLLLTKIRPRRWTSEIQVKVKLPAASCLAADRGRSSS